MKANIEALKSMTPVEILQSKDFSFTDKAEALPGVVSVHHSIFELENDDVLDVAGLCRLQADTEERMIVTDRYVIAGGLHYDEDAENPCTAMDGEGKIIRPEGRYDRSALAEYYEALGLDEDGNPELKCEAVSEILGDRVVAEVRKDRSLMARLARLIDGDWKEVDAMIKKAIHQEGWEYATSYIADYVYDVPYWNRLSDDQQEKLSKLDDLLTESAAHEAWEAAREAGKIGNSLAVLLDVYEHSGIVLSIAGEGMNCRWDTSRGGAVWIPDSCAEDEIRSRAIAKIHGGASVRHGEGNRIELTTDGITWEGDFAKWADAQKALKSKLSIDPAELTKVMSEEAVGYARSCLETYNQWLGGEVYGVCVYVIDRETGERIDDEDDECWGHYGSEYAEEELESIMLNKVINLHQQTH